MQAMRPPRTPEVDELALQQSIARRASAGRGPWLTLFPFFAGEDSTTAYQEQVDEDAEMPADSGDRGPKWEKLWSGQKVIRSISSSHVLADFGHHLRSKHGSAATYALSKPADDFDAFLSHSWRDSGLLKYLALSYHFNLRSALLATLAACVLLALGHATFGAPTPLALFPSLCAADVARGFERSKGTEFILVGHATFLIVLLFGHRMPRLVRPRKLFLDKMCIHQTDEVQKRRGILSLWEFLRKSKTMVVLYNDDCARRNLQLTASTPIRRPPSSVAALPQTLTLALTRHRFGAAVVRVRAGFLHGAQPQGRRVRNVRPRLPAAAQGAHAAAHAGNRSTGLQATSPARIRHLRLTPLYLYLCICSCRWAT